MTPDIGKKISELQAKVNLQVKSRAVRAANELRNAELEVLRGQRSGRIYKKPFYASKYRASAPGEAPAVRTGQLRISWRPTVSSEYKDKTLTVRPAVTTHLPYAPILQDGSPRMAPRPYEKQIIEKALPNVKRIYSEPYLK